MHSSSSPDPRAKEFTSDQAAAEAGYSIAVDGHTAKIVNALDAQQKRALGLRLRSLESAGVKVADADVHAAMKNRKEWRRYFEARTRAG